MTSSSGLRPAPRAWAAAALMLLALNGCTRARPAVTPSPAGSATRILRADLSRVFAAPLFGHALWAVKVQSLRTGEVLYELNSARLVMPASNMKIVTLAAAADRLGWDYRFETTLASAAPIEEGVLAGDLVIVGSGDPSINERDGRAAAVFDEWAAGLRAAGVHAVAGDLVADARAFDAEALGAGWSWDYLAYGYAAPVGALQFGEDLVRLTIAPGAAPGDSVTVGVEPDTGGLTIVNRVTTGAASDQPRLDLRRLPGQSRLELRGAVPAGAEPLVRTASVDDPAAMFAHAARGALAARGIDIRGEARVASDADEPGQGPSLQVLVSTQSPPLSAIATVLMKVSQNLYAETLLKTLGRDDGPGSAERGREAVRDVLAGWGLDPGALVQYDGSGLSRYNYVTADLVVAILKHLHDDARHREPFLATLPIGGRDGSIAGRFTGTLAEDNVRAKTGTIANVRALSGYVTTRDGEVLVFSIIANNFRVTSSVIDYAVDTAVERLAAIGTRR